MPRCPACREWIEEQDDRVGARCPHCRAALHKPAPAGKRPAAAKDQRCAAHPTSPAAGRCAGCGAWQCDVCRTRWRGQVLCVACVEKAVKADEARPRRPRGRALLALVALLLGLLAWAPYGTLGIVHLLDAKPPDGATGLALLLGLAVLAGPFLALAGLVIGSIALRARGWHLVPAALGVMLTAAYGGVLLGVIGKAVAEESLRQAVPANKVSNFVK